MGNFFSGLAKHARQLHPTTQQLGEEDDPMPAYFESLLREALRCRDEEEGEAKGEEGEMEMKEEMVDELVPPRLVRQTTRAVQCRWLQGP